MFVSFENLQEVMYEMWAGADFFQTISKWFFESVFTKKGGEKKI